MLEEFASGFCLSKKCFILKPAQLLKKLDRSEQEKELPRPSKDEWTAKHAEIVRKNKVSPR